MGLRKLAMILNKDGIAFNDGLYNVTNSLANTRNAITNNVATHAKMDYGEMNSLYKSGIGNKIIRLKSGYALRDTITFESTSDENTYRLKLASDVKEATKWMLSFGRGIIVFHHVGDDLSKPLGKVDELSVKISTFSGDMVSVFGANYDLQSDFYMRPEHYNVRGYSIHNSRVVDFKYVSPVETELPTYRYGGISEFELIRDQLIADGIVSRGSASMVDKSSSMFYKVEGFKQAMATKTESNIIEYFTQIENLRSVHGAGILDAEDGVEAITQALQNLQEVDQITLKRIAMVTGISLIDLVGETPGGLGETGGGELRATRDMVQALQSDYLLKPIQECMTILGLGSIGFKEGQGQTALELARYEQIVIDNSVKLASIGEDYEAYLSDKDIVTPDTYDTFFEAGSDKDTPDVNNDPGTDSTGTADPKSSLNGGQVTSLLDIINRVVIGEVPKTAAAGIISLAFPISYSEAMSMMADVEEGSLQNAEETEGSQIPVAAKGPGEPTIESTKLDGSSDIN